MLRLLSTFAPILLLVGCAGAAPGAAPAPGARPPSAELAAAQALAQRLLIVDTHIDVPYRLEKGWVDVSQRTAGGDFDYPRADAGGLDAAFMSIYVPAAVDAAGDAFAFAEQLIDDVHRLADGAPDKFAVATCSADVLAIADTGRIALPLGMENGGPIGGSLDNLDHFQARGIRYITLAHSKANHISDSSYDPNERWGGLSDFGKLLVPAMNERGVLIDVSHVTDRAFWQVLELSRVPVIASHSSLRHFTPGFHRNMSDEMVAALAGNGGVIQINFGSGFLTAAARRHADARQKALLEHQAAHGLDEDDPQLAAFDAEYLEAHPYPRASVADVLDHIDRAVAIAGIEHVGIGSDYDGVGDTLPTGLEDVSTYPNLVAGLLDRGYGEEEIAAILGGNLMRVWRSAEAYAASRGYPPACRHAAQP